MTPLLTLGLCAVMVGTSFLSGVFGMAGGPSLATRSAKGSTVLGAVKGSVLAMLAASGCAWLRSRPSALGRPCAPRRPEGIGTWRNRGKAAGRRR